MIGVKIKSYQSVHLLGFKNYIKSIGFNGAYGGYIYKEYSLYLHADHYSFFDGIDMITFIDYNDLTILEKFFKKELRSIKLKKLLK